MMVGRGVKCRSDSGSGEPESLVERVKPLQLSRKWRASGFEEPFGFLVTQAPHFEFNGHRF